MPATDTSDRWAELLEHYARCRTCRAPILWARTAGGKLIPVDLDPVERGNLRLELRNDPDYADDQLHAFLCREPGAGTHVSHFATCPHARAHRRR